MNKNLINENVIMDGFYSNLENYEKIFSLLEEAKNLTKENFGLLLKKETTRKERKKDDEITSFVSFYSNFKIDPNTFEVLNRSFSFIKLKDGKKKKRF